MDIDHPDPATYIAQALSNPHIPSELKKYYEAFNRFYEHRLWYQLSATIEAFLVADGSGPFQIELYESFIKDFASKLNQLKLASIGIAVARQFTDGNAALDFLHTLTKRFDTPETPEAFVLSTMEAAHFQLFLGDNEGTKSAMDKCETILDGLDSVDLVVHAAYYRVSGDYFKAKAEYADYYKNSLLYLACVNVDKDLSAVERTQRAHDLGLSALLGKIYNFGELLMHPILDSLNGTPHEWIKHLLFAFNAGDIGKFEEILPNLSSEPILQENYSFLRQKICLMALIEAVFRRPTTDRVLPFSVIAAETRIPANEVEHLVMKALSLKLIRGTLDQASSTTSISWVQPRVLDRPQIDGLRQRLDEWCGRVTHVGDFTQIQAPELLEVILLLPSKERMYEATRQQFVGVFSSKFHGAALQALLPTSNKGAPPLARLPPPAERRRVHSACAFCRPRSLRLSAKFRHIQRTNQSALFAGSTLIMASLKIASLALKTLAKPLANNLKLRAKQHETFRTWTISLAQFMHRSEMNMRRSLLGEDHPIHIRPLNDAKAIDSGANFLSESFLFAVAAGLIFAENWRSRRKEGQRRDLIADTLTQHEIEISALREALQQEKEDREQGSWREQTLEKTVDEIVGIGVRGGWLVAPSADWDARVQLGEEAANKEGVRSVRLDFGEDSEAKTYGEASTRPNTSRVLDELDKLQTQERKAVDSIEKMKDKKE